MLNIKKKNIMGAGDSSDADGLRDQNIDTNDLTTISSRAEIDLKDKAKFKKKKAKVILVAFMIILIYC